MASIVEKFYSNFQAKNGDGMAACYHQDILFEDPGFGKLSGESAGDMWRMLCQNGKDMKIEYEIISENENQAEVHWQAWYTFSQTGNKVHNIICSKINLENGLIIDHRDEFDLRKWASQAMGWKGWLLGGTGFFKKKLHHQTGMLLKAFQNSK